MLKKTINFWQKLRKEKPEGFVGLSPMDGVTDLPMRIITAKYGGPDVIFTEFTNVEGWRRGAEALRKQLWTRPEVEGRVVAQLYGLEPENFRAVAAEIRETGKEEGMGFAGIDINMGCPAKNVAQNGAGAGLIRNKTLAKEIYLATVEGAGASGEVASISAKTNAGLPVSIKTRLGYNEPEVEEWLGWILGELKPAALTIHGRTYKQAYAGQADWDLIGRAVKLAREMGSETVILGNGDVRDRLEAEKRVRESGVDGVLIGRASFGSPWVFSENGGVGGKNASVSEDNKSEVDKNEVGIGDQNRDRVQDKIKIEEKDKGQSNPLSPAHYLMTNDATVEPKKSLAVALEHARLYEELFGRESHYSFLPMRKHLAWYTRGFPGAAEVRVALTQTNSAAEVAEVLAHVDVESVARV